jgi:hypothetical protein
MADIIDTVEVHKAVEDTDRFDTSQGDTSITYEKLSDGEYRFIGEYKGEQLDQIMPSQPVLPFIAAYNPETRNIYAVTSIQNDWQENSKFVRFITE